ALISAMRQVGATIGVAILGTVLSSAYRSQADVSGLPPAAAAAVRNGIAVARQAAPTALPDTVRTAFAHALDVMLGVCGGLTLASALLALAFLPRPTPTPAPAGDDTRVPAQITQQQANPNILANDQSFRSTQPTSLRMRIRVYLTRRDSVAEEGSAA